MQQVSATSAVYTSIFELSQYLWYIAAHKPLCDPVKCEFVYILNLKGFFGLGGAPLSIFLARLLAGLSSFAYMLTRLWRLVLGLSSFAEKNASPANATVMET